MIVTLTANPSLDRTVTTVKLALGEVNRSTHTRIDPGGKGVNVASALHRNGHPTLAVLPVGGPDGAFLQQLLSDAGVPFAAVPCAGNTRTNIAIVDEDGTTTKVNEPGPQLSQQTLDSLLSAIPSSASWVVLCGSLPPGVKPSWLADAVRAAPGRVVVDSSGAPLAAAIAAKPALIKPNHEELQELTGHRLATLGDVIAAAESLIEDGVQAVVASLGSHGALWVSPGQRWLASATVPKPRSSVGAGDCLLAGLLAALNRGDAPGQALKQGVAWGAAAVSLPGSQAPGPTQVSSIQVSCTEDPDPGIRLSP